jgi:hypothetical protein
MTPAGNTALPPVGTSPQRTRIHLDHLLKAFRQAFPHHEGDLEVRRRLAALLRELAEDGILRLPKLTNRRAYDHAERIALPRYITRLDLSRPLRSQPRMWRPELAFAENMAECWHDALGAIQNWLRNGGSVAVPIALRERSVEIFGDEKFLDGLLGTQLFSPGRLSLDLLRCYLPDVPICVKTIETAGARRPLLVLENLTTFDTLGRWNAEHRCYSGVAFGGGTAFVSSCRSLLPYLAHDGCSGQLLYFGDVDPTGLWIPVRAARESGIPIQADESLYGLLFRVAEHKPLVHGDSIVCEITILDWLPSRLRKKAAECFESGRRLPQELISLHDLRGLSQGA